MAGDDAVAELGVEYADRVVETLGGGGGDPEASAAEEKKAEEKEGERNGETVGLLKEIRR